MEWYEPGEDSYTLVDVLLSEKIAGKVVVDLGCSTGVLTDILERENFVISVDLNEKALLEMLTQKTAIGKASDKSISTDKITSADKITPTTKNLICTDLLKGISQDEIDICVFNPPYVPDFDCPILGGGFDGREVIDRFISSVEIKTVYLLVILANKPGEVVELFRKRGYAATILKSRKVVGETIVVIKATLQT